MAIIRRKDERKFENNDLEQNAKKNKILIITGRRVFMSLLLPRTPNYNNYDSQVKHTNSTQSRLCIIHEIPKLFQENYLQKINSQSYQGYISYARKYIINTYEAECVVPNCYICKRNIPRIE